MLSASRSSHETLDSVKPIVLLYRKPQQIAFGDWSYDITEGPYCRAEGCWLIATGELCKYRGTCCCARQCFSSVIGVVALSFQAPVLLLASGEKVMRSPPHHAHPLVITVEAGFIQAVAEQLKPLLSAGRLCVLAEVAYVSAGSRCHRRVRVRSEE